MSLFNSFKKGLIVIDTTKDSWFLEYVQERIIPDLQFKPNCKYYIHTDKGVKGYVRLPLTYRRSIKIGELLLVPVMEFSKENPDKQYVKPRLAFGYDIDKEVINLIQKQC